MEDNKPQGNIPQKEHSTRNLHLRKEEIMYNLSDLRRIVNLRYTGYTEFARRFGWSKSTASALLNGHWIPTKADIIQKIADELGLNHVKLAQLFARIQDVGFTTADKYEVKKDESN
jgi:transcriptional regulator with XRE-family HTH domain